ncbi:MAG TPA: hypothetical protein VE011_02185 [Candidatus Dormibacteraeota bacterium]|nr:hypothetical protein [Candidatus Dormibacteraeota bacterium]
MAAHRRAPATLSLAICLALAACSTAAPTSVPLFSGSGPGATAATLPPASFGPPPSQTPPDDAAPLSLDSSLLALLPATVAGINVTEDPDAAAASLGNASLPALATALDAAVAVDAGNGNLVYALVVRIRPTAFGDEAFRQWRDSYDQGACAAGGGVIGNAGATLGGRQTFITSCVGGMHTYHVFLKSQGIVISASAIGPGRFGELLVTNLRVPS